MGVLKADYPPLLAPGRHFMALADVERLCVLPFSESSRDIRERLFIALEQLVQEVLTVKLPCRIFVDGSFLTSKPAPDDVDVVISIDNDVQFSLTQEQRELLDLVNEEECFAKVDCTAFFSYPHGDKGRGSALDAQYMIEGYGIEHSKQHLKGYVVLRMWETNVGIRICY